MVTCCLGEKTLNCLILIGNLYEFTSKMELDWSHNEERQRGTLRYSFGMETRREEKTRSKNSMEENG